MCSARLRNPSTFVVAPRSNAESLRARSTSVSSPPDGLGGRASKHPARALQRACAPRRVKGALAPGCARPGLGAACEPSHSMSAGPRARPLIEVRPAPGDGAMTQTYRRGEGTVGDQAVDRRAAQAGHGQHRRHSCEEARWVASRRRQRGDGGLHRYVPVGGLRPTLVAVGAKSRDDLRRKTIAEWVRNMRPRRGRMPNL